MIPPPPSSTLFPYTTLFRSRSVAYLRQQRPRSRRKRSTPCALVVVDLPDAVRPAALGDREDRRPREDRKSTRLNSSHRTISYAVFCLKKKKKKKKTQNIK